MTACRTWLAGALVTALLTGLSACRDESGSATAGADDSTPGSDGLPVFRDVSARTGIAFRHRNGATPERYLPETMGSGVAVIDFDGDGLPDLYFVDSGPVPKPGDAPAPGGNRLYRNLGGLRFEDVTAKAGAEGRGFGMGAVTGDYDSDGDQDLYITGFGPNILYRNNGDRTFTDVTAAAGAGDDRFSTGAAFVDFDADGRLDLFVQNYVEFSTTIHRPCFRGGKVVYCTPDQYSGVPCRLLRNRGDGSFEDVSAASGIGAKAGKGLGVCTADLDDDGRADIYCANDTCMNFVFHNLGGGRFEELGLVSGAGFGENGKEHAGMGVDAADVTGDQRPELVVANFHFEPNAVYRNEGGMFFTEVSALTGMNAVSLARLGFGVRLLDYDLDGIQDLVVANGHVDDNGADFVPPTPYAQPPSLFRGLGSLRFEDLTARAGKRFGDPMVGRGLAAADLDNDGDLDLVFTTNGGAPRIFENAGDERRSWIAFHLVGTQRDATAIGARVTVEAGGRTQVQEVRSGGSYLSQSDLRVFFGLGSAEKADKVTVRWPGGVIESATGVPARRHHVFVEGRGLK